MAKSKDQIVLVKWFDASFQHGECTYDDLDTRVELRSAGLLVKEDAETITIAMERYEDGRAWRHVAHIPKVNVIKIRRIPI